MKFDITTKEVGIEFKVGLKVKLEKVDDKTISV